LLEALEQLDHFTYRTAHDLKGPIARILGLCYLGKLEIKDSNIHPHFERIKDVADDMGRLLSRLMGTHEIRVKKLDFMEVDVKKAIFSAIKRVKETVEVEVVTFDLDVEEGLIFSTDYWLFEVMLVNLIENAVVYRDERKNKCQVKIRAKKDQSSQLQISVMDNGLGVPEEVGDNVFEMFIVGNERSKGAGLGLYEVKVIANKLKGSVSLQKSITKMTEFRVCLQEFSISKYGGELSEVYIK